MKKNLFLTLVFCLLISATSTKAEVTVDQITDPEYLINSGYSQALAEDVFITKNRTNGEPCEPLYEKNQNKFIKYLKSFYAYIDPAQENDLRYHHDIQQSPHYTDL